MFNKPVYKCDLLSVTADIRVNNDESMRKNIQNADTEVVSTIYVQKTWNPSYFREIITGRKIPAYCVITHDSNTVLNGTTEEDVPKYPVFIKYHMTVGDEGVVLNEDLVKATADEVITYTHDHVLKDEYALSLYEVFERGMKYYNDSKAKGTLSDNMRIKKMLKAIKMTRKI